MFVLGGNDYEGFNPKTDIVYQSDDLEDILMYYLTDILKIKNAPTADQIKDAYKNGDLDKMADDINGQLPTRRIACDSIEFLLNAIAEDSETIDYIESDVDFSDYEKDNILKTLKHYF